MSSSRGLPTLENRDWKKCEKFQCQSHLSKQGRHVLMVGRESLCPGSCTSPWSSSSLYQLKRRKAGGCRHGNEDTQHKVKTCQIGWNLQKECRGTVCTLTRHLSLSVDVCVLGAQSCLTLCNPIDCNPPGSSVHGIL